MHHPTYSITHTTAFVTPVVEHWLEREIVEEEEEEEEENYKQGYMTTKMLVWSNVCCVLLEVRFLALTVTTLIF